MKTNVFLIVLLLTLFSKINAQKITGYLPSYRNVTPVTGVQYDKLTDIVFAFINPDLSGNLITYTLNPSSAPFDFEMSKFIEAKAHCKTYNVRLHIAIGGADAGNLRDARLATVCGAAGTRGVLVAALLKFAITHELAGIDVDWEFPNTVAERTAHENLLSELRTAINASSRPDLLLSVAVGGEFPPTSAPSHLDYINTTAVGYPDIFYIMAYDLPSAYGTNHSSRASSNSSMDTWNTNKSIPKAKMQLGVPFYGRNSGRTLIQEYTTLATAAPATVFGADSYLYSGNTYYYNGSATLQGKVDDITNTQCGQGIMIWDLGEDRVDAYSLLSSINTRMQNNCNFTPSLGIDKTICGGSVTLDCGLLAAGKTFSWTKDGATLTGVTTPSTTVSVGGTYKITVKQGCCTKTDEVVVLEGTTVSGTGATRCGAGAVTLNVTSGAGTYDWYTTATGGTKLSTGLSYSPSITATTDYFVQRNYGKKMYNGGRQYNTPSNCWTDRWQDEEGPLGYPEWAQRITVTTDVTIDSVRIWYTNLTVNNVSVKIYAADGSTLVASSTPVNLTAIAAASTGFPLVYMLPVKVNLTPGTYFLGVHAPVTTTGLFMLNSTSGPFSSSSVPGIFTIDANTYRNFGFGFTGATVHYGTMFDWRISAPVVSACGRTQITATVNCNPVVTITSPAPPGPVAQVINNPLTLSATATDDGSIVSMNYVIKRVSDGVTVATVVGGAGPNYLASWTPTILEDYTVTAIATDNGSLTGSSSTVTISVGVLPVNLISFNGVETIDGNLLDWITSGEKNNDHFEIERSNDGKIFSVIGNKEGAGNFNEIKKYTFLDELPFKGGNYYRLVQYDFNGEFTRSAIVTINNNQYSYCNVLPNPFTGHTLLFLQNYKNAKVELINAQGILINTYHVLSEDEKIEVGEELISGIYQVRIITNGVSRLFKIVKL